jgi:hypothetical protein
LFQYAIGRIVAEHHGYALQCTSTTLPKLRVDAKRTLAAASDLPSLATAFRNVVLDIDGRRVEKPREAYAVSAGGSFKGQTFDLASVLANRTPRHIYLEGWFQRYEYYREYATRLRSWFALARPIPLTAEPGERDVLLNIRRGGDFGMLGWTLPCSYYEEALERMGDVGNVYVSGVGIDDGIRARLARYSPIYVEGTPLEHLALFARFRRVVLSNSTFAWWGGFLSDAIIYAPRSMSVELFALSGAGDVDLDLREPRYRTLDVAKPATLEVSRRTTGDYRVVDAEGVCRIVDRDGRTVWTADDALAGEIASALLTPASVPELVTRFLKRRVFWAMNELIDAGVLDATYTFHEPDGAVASRARKTGA